MDLIGIKKQTNWYVQKSIQIDKIRKDINPAYKLYCGLIELSLYNTERMIWFGSPTNK